MYSHEILDLLKKKKYLIEIKEYIKIIETSPQINNIKYEHHDDTFNIKTDDRYDFKFKVKKGEKYGKEKI